jgi:hypothetical protein
MKRILTFSFLSIGLLINAQELPTIPSNGFAFPLGSKFTIKLSSVDSVNYDYSIIAFEPFDEVVNIMENDNLFDSSGKDSTMTFYFCLGTFGEAEDANEDNLKVLLIMKNYSKLALKYTSEIQRVADGGFEATSNVGTHPGAVGTEMWPYMIYMIGLTEFRNYD